MADEKFDLVFKGQLVKSVDEAQAKRNLGALFKIDGARLDALFTGKAVTLKKNLNFDTASKYRVAIKKAGAVVELVAAEAPAVASATAKPVAAAGSQPKLSTASPSVAQPSVAAPRVPEPVVESGATKPSVSAAPAPVGSAAGQVSVDVPDFGIAPAGSDLLDGSDREGLPLMEVDVSGIGLRESDGNLVDASELSRPAPVQVNISALSLAEQQGELVKPEERKKVEPVKVDISGISLGGQGDRLSAPKEQAPAAPDVSHIQLVD